MKHPTEDIRLVLTAVDDKIASMEKFSIEDDSEGCSIEMVRELKSAQAENLALKAHLMDQLEATRKENLVLKRSLEEANASIGLINELKEEIKELKQQLAASRTVTHDQLAPHGPISDLKIKHFNSIPKNIKQFYEQMSDGDSVLSQFSELAIYKTHKSTKGAYCKRKAIYNFMLSYSEGLEFFLEKFKHLSPLQIYDQHIKKTRQN